MKKDSRLAYLSGFFRSVVFPDRCCFCGRTVPHTTELCRRCSRDEKLIEQPVCASCGRSKKDCECNGRANFYQGITAPYNYTGNVKRGITRWKYYSAFHSVSFFAKRVKECVGRDFDVQKIDVITFVPQTQDESAHRQFNQGQALAEETGRQMNIPVEPLLVKVCETSRQHRLPFALKSGNVFGAFDCSNADIEGRTILLIDDIKTSASTLNECTKMLHLAGAAAVYCAVIAIS